MRALSVLVVGLLVTGCSGPGQRPGSPAATSPDDGKWFCQMKSSGDAWDCVQDAQLAEYPKPTRLPRPAPAEPADPPPEPAMLPDQAPLSDSSLPPGQPRPAELPPDEAPRGLDAPAAQPPVSDGPSPPVQAAALVPAASNGAASASADLPEYARLAYQPAQPVALTELPDRFYAVQLIAMPSEETLERFVERQQIRNVSAARVERDGELLYVLLLGIYETRELAERAVAAMPELEDVQPWIRPLGSLQAAMRRADSMSGSTRY